MNSRFNEDQIVFQCFMICLRFKVNDSQLNSIVNSLPLRPRTISFEEIKS